jgi:hypothetical protein
MTLTTYTKTTWANGGTGASAERMNNLESGVESAHSELETHKTSTDHDARYYTETESDAKYELLSDVVTSPAANKVLKLNASAKFPNTALITGSGNGLDADTVDAAHAGVAPNNVLLLGALPVIEAATFRKVAGNTMRNEHNATVTTTAGAYTKLKSIVLTNGINGTVRVKIHATMTGESGYNYDGYWRVYKNGVALGPVKQLWLGSPNTSTSGDFSDDIDFGYCAPGTTIELWVYGTGGVNRVCGATTFQLCYDNDPSIVVASTNTTP